MRVHDILRSENRDETNIVASIGSTILKFISKIRHRRMPKGIPSKSRQRSNQRRLSNSPRRKRRKQLVQSPYLNQHNSSWEYHRWELFRIKFSISSGFRKIDEFHDDIKILGESSFFGAQVFDDGLFEFIRSHFGVVLAISKCRGRRTFGSFEQLNDLLEERRVRRHVGR
jgi:hypothetical protein